MRSNFPTEKFRTSFKRKPFVQAKALRLKVYKRVCLGKTLCAMVRNTFLWRGIPTLLNSRRKFLRWKRSVVVIFLCSFILKSLECIDHCSLLPTLEPHIERIFEITCNSCNNYWINSFMLFGPIYLIYIFQLATWNVYILALIFSQMCVKYSSIWISH